MPVIDADGCPIHVEVEGPERAPVLMLSNSLGTTLHMWDGQVEPFTKHFRLVRYDRRGHGKSGVPKGPYTMERLGRDVLAVLDGLGVKRVAGAAFHGRHGRPWLPEPTRARRAARSHQHVPFFPTRAAGTSSAGRGEGIAASLHRNSALVPGVFWHEPQTVADQAMFAATFRGYRLLRAAARMDQRDLLPRIKAPTLVIAGKHDGATPPEANEYISNHIPGAKFALVDAAHLSNIEQSEAYTKAVLAFLLAK